MFLSNETLVELISLGAPAEKLAKILRMIEADMEVVAAPRPVSGAERTRRYRERRAGISDDHRHISSPTVTEGHTASRCDGNDEPLARVVNNNLLTEVVIPPTSPNGEASPKGAHKQKAARPRKLSMAPESWEPSARVLAWAEAEGFTPGEIERELAKFRDHEFATPKSDFDAAFRNWIRRNRPANLRLVHGQPSNNPSGCRGDAGKSGTQTLLESVARHVASRECGDGG